MLSSPLFKAYRPPPDLSTPPASREPSFSQSSYLQDAQSVGGGSPVGHCDSQLHTPQKWKSLASEALDHIIYLFKQHRKGEWDGRLWHKERLEPEEFDRLEDRLRKEGLKGYVEDKIRYDYDEEAATLTIRMTTETHEYFTQLVSHEILKQFQQIANTTTNPHLADYLENIQDGRSSRLRLANPESDASAETPAASGDSSIPRRVWEHSDGDAEENTEADSGEEVGEEAEGAQTDAVEDEDNEEKGVGNAAEETQLEPKPARKRRDSKCPDAQFARIGVFPPFLVLEVAFSQKRKDLPHLADWYIVRSKAQIAIVIGFDIAYKSNKNSKNRGNQEAKVFVYQPAQRIDENGELRGSAKEVLRSTFRTRSGKPGRGELKLYLRDMLPTEFFPENSTDNDLAVNLSITKLKGFLNDAERQHATALAAQEDPDRWPSPPRKGWESVKWESRKRSPEQELKRRDEKKFKRQEDKAQRRENMADGPARRPSGSLSLPELSMATRSRTRKDKGAS
ncbi:hypothetical protein H2201_009219 [Coniosporium apollinis]|uniref:Uncharacterized protein n=1 Tax=Coniosporium apollinis TaxID=61459 RepID=A0ABQ9NIE0_9PEZI|nr:hypothetical protein H2201_009219 [Coniosporium apollinis]